MEMSWEEDIRGSDSENSRGLEDVDEEEFSGSKVVSEINTFLVSSPDVKPLLRSSNRVARFRFDFPPQLRSPGESKAEKGSAGKFVCSPFAVDKDEDGDLIIPGRKGNAENQLELFIEYENETSLEQVGLQVWRGALLLADFIIHSAETFFRGKTILEFGSGTGLTSLVTAKVANKVIATDLGDDDGSILKLIEANVTHNKEQHVRSEFQVKALDFKNLSWSEDLEASIKDADVLLAADVVYHEKITEAFVKTLQKCLQTGKKSKSVFIAIEKRYVFTVTDLDVVAPMYEAFMEQLHSVLGLSPNSLVCSEETEMASSGPSTTGKSCSVTTNSTAGANPRLSIRSVHIDFPQYFSYERTKELVLWHIKSEPVLGS